MAINIEKHQIRTGKRADGKGYFYKSYKGLGRKNLATGASPKDRMAMREAIVKSQKVEELQSQGVPLVAALADVMAAKIYDQCNTMSAARKAITDAVDAAESSPAVATETTRGDMDKFMSDFIREKKGSVSDSRLYSIEKELKKFRVDFPYHSIRFLSGRAGMKRLTEFKNLLNNRIDNGDLKASSANQALQVVKQFLDYLSIHELIDEPTGYKHRVYGLSIKIPKAQRKVKPIRNEDTFSRSAIAQLILCCDPDYSGNQGGFKKAQRISKEQHAQQYDVLRACIWLAINCGFYPADCAKLQVHEVKTRGKRKSIDVDRVKSGVERSFPLWKETHDSLKPFLRGKQPEELVLTQYSGKPLGNWKTNVVGKRFIDLVTKMNRKGLLKKDPSVERRTFKSLRKSVATFFEDKGGVEARAWILSHEDAKMGSVYGAVGAGQKRMDDLSHQYRDYVVQHLNSFKKKN